jgi:predicted lipoprotein with Yx(FWY)xxD motif
LHSQGQTIQWPKEKDRLYNGQKKRTDYAMAKRKGQTMQWPKEKDRLYNGQKKRTDYTMAKTFYLDGIMLKLDPETHVFLLIANYTVIV